LVAARSTGKGKQVTGRAYVDWTIGDYLDKLASESPEPGGGSVAALVGALGAALVTMVTSLTLGKDKYADVQDDMVDIRQRSEKLSVRLQELVSLDAMAYAEVAAAMKLPQDDAQRKTERTATLQAALKGAVEVPLEIAEAAAEVARLSLPAADKGNAYAISDAALAAVLADAAAHSSALNVKINISFIDDKAFASDRWGRIEAVLSETGRLRDAVLALTYRRL
jgi:formiminotetrahydrofolate cyclodeaminase